MKCLWSISLSLLFLTGCVSIKPSHLTCDPSPVTRHPSPVTRYTPPISSHLFKATLDIKKHHLTGMLVIKRMDTLKNVTTSVFQGIYRIVFVNEVGMTIFDLEMAPDSFKVVQCFASLNKKALMKIFETNFRMLTWSGAPEDIKVYRQAETNNLVVSGRAGKYSTWQTFSPGRDTLWRTSAKATIADPVLISFYSYSKGYPAKIILENPFIGMTLTLKKMGK